MGESSSAIVHSGSNETLANLIAGSRVQRKLRMFANGELQTELMQSVRGKHVFLLHGFDSRQVNSQLMELLMTIQSCRLASAEKSNNEQPFPTLVSVVLPYFPYSRPLNVEALLRRIPEQVLLDRVNEAPQDFIVSDSGCYVARMITASGADHLIVVDFHSPQYEGFFDIPVDNLPITPTIKKFLEQQFGEYLKDMVIVSPDVGGSKRAAKLASDLGLDFVLLNRGKEGVMLIGDVKDRRILIFDDLVDTSQTLVDAARALKTHGSSDVYGLIIHGLFSSDALSRIQDTEELNMVFVSNTISQDEHVRLCSKIVSYDVSSKLMDAMERCQKGQSVSEVF